MRVLTVTEIRRHLYWAGGRPQGAGAGSPSTALLGQLFHELYAALTGPDLQTNLAAPLELADASEAAWRQSLIDHAFTALLAPAFAQHESVLQTHGAQVLRFWTAAQELCGWLAGLMHGQRAADANRSLEALRRDLFAGSELDLEVDLTDPDWPEPIRLQGRAGAVSMRHADAANCLIELKLGRTYPDADLLQGCLYHLLFARSNGAAADASMTLVSFEPQRREYLFDAARLRETEKALKALLGELVGFTPPAQHASVVAQPNSVGIAPVAAGVLQQIKRRLAAAFAEFGAPLSIADDAMCGPAFIRFFATPEPGVSMTRVARLAENVWMRIGTSQPPKVALHGGRAAIDVERPDRQPMNFKEWRTALPLPLAGGSARFAVGVAVDGGLYTADLSESQSPHLLVAGTPGSGKSEWLRALLASLLTVNTPATLRVALIDPTRLTFASLERSAFLWKPIVYDSGAVELLDQLIEEMERRYALLGPAGADDLARYNELQGAGAPSRCPRIVCVCDEFADLVLRDKPTRTEVETRVARLGVKGRAAGIHLVFATQRAGRDVLNGAIDGHLPARVALSVARKADSRLVLGEPGAETLLGKGDLLYKDIGAPVRLQGLLVAPQELTALAAG
jgi:hypothetical protein